MPSSVRSRVSCGLRSYVSVSFGVPRNSPTIRRPSAMVSSIASSSAMRTGLLCETIGPSRAILIFCTRAATIGGRDHRRRVRMRGE